MTSPHLIGDIASTLLTAQKEWGNMRDYMWLRKSDGQSGKEIVRSYKTKQGLGVRNWPSKVLALVAKWLWSLDAHCNKLFSAWFRLKQV